MASRARSSASCRLINEPLSQQRLIRHTDPLCTLYKVQKCRKQPRSSLRVSLHLWGCADYTASLSLCSVKQFGATETKWIILNEAITQWDKNIMRSHKLLPSNLSVCNSSLQQKIQPQLWLVLSKWKIILFWNPPLCLWSICAKPEGVCVCLWGVKGYLCVNYKWGNVYG